jgi:hypothetical protein
MAVLMPISALVKGEYVQLRENGPVWVRGAYDRSSKTYELSRADDMNRCIYRKGDVLVWVGFTY